jgi:hypothetical protein
MQLGRLSCSNLRLVCAGVAQEVSEEKFKINCALSWYLNSRTDYQKHKAYKLFEDI